MLAGMSVLDAGGSVTFLFSDQIGTFDKDIDREEAFTWLKEHGASFSGLQLSEE